MLYLSFVKAHDRHFADAQIDSTIYIEKMIIIEYKVEKENQIIARVYYRLLHSNENIIHIIRNRFDWFRKHFSVIVVDHIIIVIIIRTVETNNHIRFIEM